MYLWTLLTNRDILDFVLHLFYWKTYSMLLDQQACRLIEMKLGVYGMIMSKCCCDGAASVSKVLVLSYAVCQQTG